MEREYNRIALFYWEPKITSIGIAIGTRCTLTHCAVEIDGVWKDASESRGNYGPVNMTDLENRKCLIIGRVPIITLGYSVDKKFSGKLYDFPGVALWLPARIWCDMTKRPLKPNDQPYCFEVGYFTLTGVDNDMPISGCDIREMAEARHLPISYGRFGAIA